MQARACWCRTVKLGEREGKEIEGRKIKVRGAAAAATTRRPRGGAKCLCAGCQGAAVESLWAASK